MARHDSEHIEEGISKIPLCSCSPLPEVDNHYSQRLESEQLEVKTEWVLFANLALNEIPRSCDGQGWKSKSRICSWTESSGSGHQRTDFKGTDLLQGVRGKDGDCFTKPALLVFPSGFLGGDVFNSHQFFSPLKYWCVQRGFYVVFPRPKLLILMYNDAVGW